MTCTCMNMKIEIKKKIDATSKQQFDQIRQYLYGNTCIVL